VSPPFLVAFSLSNSVASKRPCVENNGFADVSLVVEGEAKRFVQNPDSVGVSLVGQNFFVRKLLFSVARFEKNNRQIGKAKGQLERVPLRDLRCPKTSRQSLKRGNVFIGVHARAASYRAFTQGRENIPEVLEVESYAVHWTSMTMKLCSLLWGAKVKS
jgi:hypothetical protein